VAAAAANINFTWIVFHRGEHSSPGLTLKYATRSSRMAPLDRTRTTSY